MTSPDQSDLDETSVPNEPLDSNETVVAASADGIRHRRAIRHAVTMGVIFMLLAAAINLPMRYVASGGVIGTSNFVDFASTTDPLPVMAGWPYRYSIRYDAVETRPALHVFSVSALLRNAGLALAIIAIVCLFVYRRSLRVAATKSRKFRVSIGDLLALTLLIAAPIGAWQWLGRRQAESFALANEVGRGDGAAMLASWTPAVLSPYLPDPLKNRLRHIRAVRLENADESLIAKVAKLPTLTRFACGGGDYDLAILKPLSHSIHLNDLRISGRALDEETVRWIAKKYRLHSLNLMRTNVNAQAALALGELPGLKNLNLMRSDLKLSELGRPGWAESIEVLYLPMPDTGNTASLEIDGWPKLKELHMREFDTTTNPVAMKVQLRNLPVLQKLFLDQFQKLDLELSELPQLQDIVGSSEHWQSRLPRGGAVPGALWIERFDGSGLPELADLKLFCVDMKSYSLRGPTKIKSLGMGVFYLSLSDEIRGNPYEQTLLPEHAKAMIEGIGSGDGPAEVDLDAVPLASVDLSPLANNKQLSRLMLGNSKTTLQQWRALSDMKWLRHLRISDNPLDESAVFWALESFPELDTLEIGMDPFSDAQRPNSTGLFSFSSLDTIETIELIGHKNLVNFSLKGSEYFSAHSVKIVDMPQLVMNVDVEWPQSIEIRNSPMVSGIKVDGVFPEQFIIDSIPNLSYFAAGGQQVDDRVAESLLNSNRLKTLTLAHPAVSAESLARLPVASVEKLFLPGSQVDDNVVQMWPDLPSITHLDLSSTKITAASLPKLFASPKIESINVNHCPIQSFDIPDATVTQYLKELDLAGIGIRADQLNKILAGSALTILDLSDLDVPDEVFDAISENAHALAHLSLKNSRFDVDRLQKLIQENRGLVLDIAGSESVSTNLYTALLSAQRIKTKHEWLEYKHQFALSNQLQARVRAYVSPAEYEYRPHSMIPVDEYAQGGQYSQDFINSSMRFAPSMVPTSPDADAPVDDSQAGWFDKVVGALLGNPASSENANTGDSPEEIEKNEGQAESESTENPIKSSIPAGEQP